MNTWNRSMSVFYATIADTTTIQNMSITKMNQILLTLTKKLENESGILNYLTN